MNLAPQALSPLLVLIPALPFLGAALLAFFGRWMRRGLAATVACGAVLAAAVVSAVMLGSMLWAPHTAELSQNLGTWFSAGGVQITATLFLDHLSGILVLMVTGVSFLIHLYSTEYMEHDEGYVRFFTYLNLFVGFMLILILGNDLAVLFVGWEGVGLCSYLLIGFWFEDNAKAYAGRKAFVVNRIGDFGFLVGLFILFALFGTLQVHPVSGAVSLSTLMSEGIPLADPIRVGPLAGMGVTYGQALTVACLSLFLGATGKSAQFPLYIWLPDAMAGPTPVSALIHAATMVTAGVYMIARLSFVFAQSTTAMAVVAIVGAFTALMAAFMGFAQNDIKKVLAYSTVSQLGFMILAVGIGAYAQGVFHLLTHAFFKACLFLGAGSVILGCHHEQDLRMMGGLRKKMPRTAVTFLIACFAITGVIPLSGFFSKDAILHFAHETRLAGFEWVGPTVYWVGSLAALGTAFYMFRLYFLAFEGAPRSDAARHATERSWRVTVPLWLLALASIGAAVLGIPFAPFVTASGATLFESFTEPVFEAARRFHPSLAGEEGSGLLIAFAVALLIAWVGLLFAAWLYRWRGIEKLGFWFRSVPGRALYALSAQKLYVDELYTIFIVSPIKALSTLLWQVVDSFAIDRVLVVGSARVVAWFGSVFRYMQNGDLQRYAGLMAVGGALILWAMFQ